jgi:hypothetical protein
MLMKTYEYSRHQPLLALTAHLRQRWLTKTRKYSKDGSESYCCGDKEDQIQRPEKTDWVSNMSVSVYVLNKVSMRLTYYQQKEDQM